MILATSDPRQVVGVIELSQASYRKMLQNLGWAAGYNVLAIPWPPECWLQSGSSSAGAGRAPDECFNHHCRAQCSAPAPSRFAA